MNDPHASAVLSLRTIRDKAMYDMDRVIEAIYGKRCREREAGCACCVAWTIFDALDGLTTGEFIDEYEDYIEKQI